MLFYKYQMDKTFLIIIKMLVYGWNSIHNRN